MAFRLYDSMQGFREAQRSARSNPRKEKMGHKVPVPRTWGGEIGGLIDRLDHLDSCVRERAAGRQPLDIRGRYPEHTRGLETVMEMESIEQRLRDLGVRPRRVGGQHEGDESAGLLPPYDIASMRRQAKRAVRETALENPNFRAYRGDDVTREIRKIRQEIAALAKRQQQYYNYDPKNLNVWSEYEDEIRALEDKIEELQHPDNIYANTNPKYKVPYRTKTETAGLKQRALAALEKLRRVEEMVSRYDYGVYMDADGDDTDAVIAAAEQAVSETGIQIKHKNKRTGHGVAKVYDFAAMRRQANKLGGAQSRFRRESALSARKRRVATDLATCRLARKAGGDMSDAEMDAFLRLADSGLTDPEASYEEVLEAAERFVSSRN
jgi:hypothetical protein